MPAPTTSQLTHHTFPLTDAAEAFVCSFLPVCCERCPKSCEAISKSRPRQHSSGVRYSAPSSGGCTRHCIGLIGLAPPVYNTAIELPARNYLYLVSLAYGCKRRRSKKGLKNHTAGTWICETISGCAPPETFGPNGTRLDIEEDWALTYTRT